jgi:hypothetical protein
LALPNPFVDRTLIAQNLKNQLRIEIRASQLIDWIWVIVKLRCSGNVQWFSIDGFQSIVGVRAIANENTTKTRGKSPDRHLNFEAQLINVDKLIKMWGIV